MKKHLLSLITALVMCLSLIPSAALAEGNPPGLTKNLEGLTLTYGSKKAIDRITVDDVKKSITSDFFSPPAFYSLSITGNGVTPYCINLNQVDLTMNNVSILPLSDTRTPLYISDRTLTLQGENTVSFPEDGREHRKVIFSGTTIGGDGSLSLKDLSFNMENARLTGGSLSAVTGDCSEQFGRIRGLIVDGDFLIDGGSLTIKQGDYYDGADYNMLIAPYAPILLCAPTVINGGQIFVDSGTDLRTGKPIPYIDFGSYQGNYGSLTVNGGIFNVGDPDANTVLGVPVAPDCRVVKNQDPATKDMYPFRVQKSTETLAIYPKNAVANPEKPLKLRASGTASANVTWSLSGNSDPLTSIDSDGTLYVSPNETAKNLTVTASGGGTSVSAAVSVEPEVFDIWFVIQQRYRGEYTVYDHKQLKYGEIYTLPQVENIPGFKHVLWYDTSDPYSMKEFSIGESITADHSEIYWAGLVESEEKFMIGGVSYDMPSVGGCINSKGGTAREGDWWLELPAASCPELTLNGAELTEENITSYNGRADQIMIPAKKQLTIHVRGENRILPPKAPPKSSFIMSGIYQALNSQNARVIMDFEEGSTLTVQGRSGQKTRLIDFGRSSLALQGSGRLLLVAEDLGDDLIYDYYVTVEIGGNALMEYDLTHISIDPSDYIFNIRFNPQSTTLSDQGTLLFRGDGVTPQFVGSTRLTLPEDGSMHITAGSSPDGQNARTVTKEELFEQSACLGYFKISPEPAPAHVPSYPLWLGGVQVTDENKDDILGNGKASYDPSSSTLSLNNVRVRAPGGKLPSEFSGLTYTGKKLIIENTGNSSFTGPENEFTSLGFFNADIAEGLDLQIKGEGVLRFAGDPHAKWSYGGSCFLQSINIDGSVKLELLGKTCCAHSSSTLWYKLDNSPTGNVLCSSSMSGKNPAPWRKNIFPDGMPYAVFYHPVISSMEMECAFPQTDWNTIGYLVPLINSPANITVYLRPKLLDQIGIAMDAEEIKDQFEWSVSGEMSSENLEQNLNTWGAEMLKIDPQNNTLTINPRIEPCYIGLELTHVPSGKKIAKPAFLVSHNPCSKIEVSIKPEYADRVYRDGDLFDYGSFIITRFYDDVPSTRHPEAFMYDYYNKVPVHYMSSGINNIDISYSEENMIGQVFTLSDTLSVVALDRSFIEPSSGSIQVTSPSAATLVIASYDSQGRMTDISTHSIPADTQGSSFPFAEGQKAFLLDENYVPLCPSASNP